MTNSEPDRMLAGEQEAWKKLNRLGAAEVARRSGAEQRDGGLVLPVFGQPCLVDSVRQTIDNLGNSHFHAGELTHFGLLVPLYLTDCAAVEPTGMMVSPLALPHGSTFFRGPHELPLEVIAHHFGSNPDKFLEVGLELGGSSVDHGDAAVTIPVFPRLPVTLILWTGDLEFPARSRMLVDETATMHFSLDAIWAALVMTAQAMTHLAGPHH